MNATEFSKRKRLPNDCTASSPSTKQPPPIPGGITTNAAADNPASGRCQSGNKRPRKANFSAHPLVQSLRRIDPLLQFLCKATGQIFVPFSLLQKSLSCVTPAEMQSLQQYGVLRLVQEESIDAPTDMHTREWKVGFPPPPLTTEASNEGRPKASHNAPSVPLLHGFTKRAAQQRLQWLQKQLSEAPVNAVIDGDNSQSTMPHQASPSENLRPTNTVAVTPDPLPATTTASPPASPSQSYQLNNSKQDIVAQKKALQTLRKVMKWTDDLPTTEEACLEPPNRTTCVIPEGILPKQVSFAGSQPAQSAVYAELPPELSIPTDVFQALVPRQRPLYRHQVEAVTAALQGQHVSLTTGTGSGKSLAFLLPVVATLVQTDKTAIVLFPTKALAQDQYGKLQALASLLENQQALRPATLDGDTSHSQRKAIALSANLILTNPDTLHAAILPNWEKGYQSLLARLAFVVVDEAHTYQGIFGAHVALILARLRRLCAVARSREFEDHHKNQGLRFIATSATLPWPEVHLRKLCPIGETEHVVVVTEDTSPRAAKHFFVWNPPLLSAQGASSGCVTLVHKKKESVSEKGVDPVIAADANALANNLQQSIGPMNGRDTIPRKEPEWHRRHAADETALLLARAISQGVRCMAFAKTRNLVEWIFERTIAALRSHESTAHLARKVESYRGGYTRSERRKIEERLFRNELLGVVGTNALELGVDVGGIDLTLHCGYPSSYASLVQQAGRAGRGRSQSASCSIVVCFNSPSEQHLWRYPTALLSKGLAPSDTIPLNKGTVQSHLLCASHEFPLTGSLPAESIVVERQDLTDSVPDWNLFGGKKLYEASLEELIKSKACDTEVISLPFDSSVTLYKARPSPTKAWSLVSIRSIEPVNYSIVDLSHPEQGGRMDGIYSEEAVLDTLPYSRIFYHAHPGAIITHRGTRYKVVSMTRPPECLTASNHHVRRNMQLSAFAKPTSSRYSTRPLSHMHITIIKQFETVVLKESIKENDQSLHEKVRGEVQHAMSSPSSGHDSMKNVPNEDTSIVQAPPKQDDEIYLTSFAGCGVVNVKRTVHGYKKLSLITRSEISRSELALPDMEFETFGIWFDTEPDTFNSFLGAKYGEGVHALSHAILAVAPLFEPGVVREDLECDHSYMSPTRLVIFDERAGGSGSCERLWKHFFVSENNIIDAALDLLQNCDTCTEHSGYEGGCPACLHASQCLKFNMNLSRSAAIILGKRLLERIKTTELYKRNELAWRETKQLPPSPSRNLTPRRKARHEAMKRAKEIRGARTRQFVVGRPCFAQMEFGEQDQELE